MSETRMFSSSDQFDRRELDDSHRLDEPPTAAVPSTVWSRLGRDTVYVLSALPLATVGFVVVVAGWALGASTAVLGVGLVVLVGTALALRGLAFTERARLRSLQGREPQRPVYLVAPVGEAAYDACSRPLPTRSRGWTPCGHWSRS